ncbi:hypothetical protein [Hymenobacter cellulosivorans]|uniref:Uncharacterized protein n=1 Tax=Hymenobacter cellulosivorans TaxID=2932249 RepID=A0ABY4FFW4_9BACT|nr:hypothetical protein [Hymenobacter cellulosivorans]UOQ55551.1 hypothetical protein MUN80_12505 [Hymenobacter cellulosivorans]
MDERNVRVTGYGFFCLSIETFNKFINEKKIKSKKINKCFDKNRPLIETSLKEGAWIPISTINSTRYVVDVGSESEKIFDTGWQKVLTLDNCNLHVGTDAAVWVGSLDGLDDWDPGEYDKKDSISYQTLDGITLFRGFKFEVKSGMYTVKVIGFKRKEALAHPAANFGFAFELTETESFDSFTNPLVEDVNIAKM